MVHVKIFSLNVRNIVDQNSVLKHLKDDMEKIHFLALQKHFTKHFFETFLPHLALGIDFTAAENQRIVLMGDYNIDFFRKNQKRRLEQKTKIRNGF